MTNLIWHLLLYTYHFFINNVIHFIKRSYFQLARGF